MVAESLEQANNESIDAQNLEEKAHQEELLIVEFHENSDIQDISSFLEGKSDQEFESLYNKSIKEKIISLLEVEYLKNSKNFDIHEGLRKVLYGSSKDEIKENAFMQTKGVALDNKDELYNELIVVISKTDKEAHENVYEAESRKDSHEYLRDTAYDNLYENIALGNSNLAVDISSEEKKEYIDKNTDKENNVKQAEELIYNKDFIEQFFSKDKKTNEADLEFFENPEVQEDLTLILSNFVIDSELSNLSEANKNDLKQINVALNSSFDIQIANVLHNKVNYPEKTVDKMIREIHNGNPFEKIEIFEELKQLVNNKEGISGKAMEKGKKDITSRVQKKLLLKLERQKEELTILITEGNLNSKELHDTKEEIEQLEEFILNNKIVEGEVFSGNSEIESIGENNPGESNEIK